MNITKEEFDYLQYLVGKEVTCICVSNMPSPDPLSATGILKYSEENNILKEIPWYIETEDKRHLFLDPDYYDNVKEVVKEEKETTEFNQNEIYVLRCMFEAIPMWDRKRFLEWVDSELNPDKLEMENLDLFLDKLKITDLT